MGKGNEVGRVEDRVLAGRELVDREVEVRDFAGDLVGLVRREVGQEVLEVDSAGEDCRPVAAR